MNRARIALWGIGLLVAGLDGVAMSGPQRSAEEATPRTCVLSGTVIDADTEEPVPYFHLLYMKKSGVLLDHLETDANGQFRTTAPKGSERYFRFTRSRRGTYIIDWDAQAQLTAYPFRGMVNDDMTDLVFKVKLWPVMKLTGKVVDSSGQGVRDASIYIHCDVPPVKTDASGTFCLEVAPTERDFNLFAISTDGDLAGQVHLKAGSTTATIGLEPTASYAGRVIDMQGRSVGPFKFLVGLRLNGSVSDCLQQSLQADADGTFGIDSLCPKTQYHLWWFPDDQVNHTIGEHGEKQLNLAQLEPDHSIDLVVTQYLNMIAGTVRDAEGAPVEGAKVMVHTRHGIQAQRRRGRAVLTDKNGRFTLENLTDGLALFHVYKKGYRMKYLWRPTDSADVEVTLQPLSQMGVCEVQIVDDAFEPMSNVPVRLDFVTGGPGKLLPSRTIETDAKGQVQFIFEDFGQDDRVHAMISCDMEGYDRAYNRSWSNADTQVMLVLHKSGPCWSGRIVDPQRKRIAEAQLYLTSMSQRVRTPQRTTVQSLGQSFFDDSSERTLITQTDADGRFELHRFNKKDFVRVTVKARGFRTEELDFSPNNDAGTILRSSGIARVEGYVFPLLPGVAVLEGVLVEAASGDPVPDVRIEFIRADNHTRDVRTDRNGAFVIGDLEPGQYVPVIRSAGNGGDARYVCIPKVFLAEAGETIQMELKTRQGVFLEGRLIESATQRPPSADRIYLVARLKSGHTIASQSIAADGTWELLLPPGDVDLLCLEFHPDIRRFIESERSLSMTIQDKEYEDLVLELNTHGRLSLQESSLLGRPLPGFEGLALSGPVADLNGKKILVGLFDMEQRPSRNCVLRLGEQAQELMGRDVAIVLVQAVPVERARLDAWTKENRIVLPIGMVRTNESQWGTGSLPWLVLADRKHRVVAEGFDLEGLDRELDRIGD